MFKNSLGTLQTEILNTFILSPKIRRSYKKMSVLEVYKTLQAKVSRLDELALLSHAKKSITSDSLMYILSLIR